MKPSAYPRLFLSYDTGWPDLRREAPPVLRIFLLLVLPFSLLPAAMIAFVASGNASYYAEHIPASRYSEIAQLFLLTELLSVPVMALAIRSVVMLRGPAVSFRQCFLLAAMAPVPMWVSSLSLLVPNIAFHLVCGFLGLLGASALLLHGIPSLLGVERGIEAEDVSYVVLSLGGLMWALMVGLLLVPLLGV
ncbi:YIP1 family protein [Chitinimonas taiwanensis]|uniref:YIP1 family protein n=1 Tax=Chitinimonas taiwanensis TaxID=240412 RepID=UPI00160AF7B1